MKQMKKVAVAVVLFIAATSFVQAQSKIAHINVTELLSQMPEMQTAQAELKKLEETYRADIQSSLDELKNKLAQYNNANKRLKVSFCLTRLSQLVLQQQLLQLAFLPLLSCLDVHGLVIQLLLLAQLTIPHLKRSSKTVVVNTSVTTQMRVRVR